jgi:nucleotide-binding universal stress UspA family protein
MEKLTTILAVIPEGGVGGILFEKVSRLVRQSGAHVELFLAAPSDYFAVKSSCRSPDCVVDIGYTMYDGDRPLREAILRRAAEIDADLLVAPRAQVNLDDCPIPVLLLGKKSWAAEPRFAATVDMAEEDSDSLARGILHVGGFLAQRFTACLDILYSEREKLDARLRMERAVKLARLVREYYVGCERLQVFNGEPEDTLPAIIAERRYDVVVLGRVPRHHELLTRFNSVSKRLMGSTDADLLLIDSEAQSARSRRSTSARQQLAHQA